MGVVYSKFFQFYKYSPRLVLMSLATVLYFYIFHGLPQVRKKRLMEKKKNPWGSTGIGRKAVGIVGLKNFGYTCYFNAVVQALASCKLFCAWIERRNQMNDAFEKRKDDQTADNENELSDDEDSAPQVPFPVIAALHEAFSLINAIAFSRDSCLSEMIPSKLICAFTKHNLEAARKGRMRKFVLNSHEEQDTHEAFNYIMETIADECSNMNKNYHSSTNLALKDSVFVDANMEVEHQNEVPAFCKLTRKPPSGSGPGGDTGKQEEFEYIEEDEATFPRQSFAESNLLRSSERPPRKQRRYQFIIPEDEDSVTKGKRSNKDWIGGSIVSRTEIHETDIKEDTKMSQNMTFDGTLGAKLVCMACNTQHPTKLDKFNCLTVTIPRRFGCRIKLEDLMLYSLRPTQVHDVNCDGCCRKLGGPTRSSFVEFSALGRLPQTFCIHINRSEWILNGDGVCVKRDEHVEFPLYLNMHKFKRILDLIKQNPDLPDVSSYSEMSKMMDQRPAKERKITDYEYLLRAVICHSGGSADSGHFITYRQSSTPNSIGEGWYLISDCQLRATTTSQVLGCKAYMLFYEKRIPTTKAILDFIPTFGR